MGANMDYDLVDLIDIKELKKLTDNWTKLIGLPMGIFDPYGNALLGSGWLSVCTDFHRVNPITRERCRHSDLETFNQLKGGKEFCFLKCPNGLVDTGAAIVIEGRYLGGLGFGQFFLEPPDMAFFSRQADEFGFDKQKYLQAVAEVPVLSMAYVEQISKIWRRLAKIIAETGLARLRLLELNRELERHRDHLSEQVEFERLIADIASKLVNTKPAQLKEAIDLTLRSLGRFLRTERSFLAQFSEDDKRLIFTNTWAAEGLSLTSSVFDMDLIAEIPWVIKQIQSGEVINAGKDLADLPDEAKELRNQLKHDGINSGVVVPVQVEGRSIGLLGLDTIVQPREYPPPIVDRLRIVADIIGSTLQRAQSQKALQESLNHVKQLQSRIEQENVYLREEIELQHRHGEIIGKSKAVRQMLIQAEQVADTDSTVMILGETGTGKELLARAIHRMSSRKHRPMITVNCAALPVSLIESEMFGREKGAFTGALSGRIGRFEVADGSTIFLDEIGELTSDIQIKLLRVIEKGHFERLGSNKTVKVDVRIIAATNRDLVKAVHDGSFRRDLYYRLNVFPIKVPSLQDRIEDLEQLVWAFVKEYGERMGKRVETIPKKSIEALKTCPWRGNIRELRNVIEQSMIITQGPTLNVQLPGTQEQRENQAVLLKDVERNHILKILKQTGWRVRGKAGAAELLGLKPTTLDARMKKLGIVRPK